MSESPIIPGPSKARSGEEALRFEAARVLTRATSDLRKTADDIDRIAAWLADPDFKPSRTTPQSPAGTQIRDALDIYRRLDVLSWISAAMDSAMLADAERISPTA